MVNHDAMTSDPVADGAGWSTLMARWSSMFTAPALEWRLDPVRARGERRDGRPIGALILAIGMLWLAVPLPAWLGGAPFPIAEAGGAGAWVSFGIGLALALWGLRILVRRQTIRIERDAVHARTRDLFGATAWREPLHRYRGVIWRSVTLERRGARPVLHLVELWHEDPARRITLLSSTSEAAAQERWQAWAQELGLPAIRQRAGEQQTAAREAAKALAGTR
jgi:hypothetical protein